MSLFLCLWKLFALDNFVFVKNLRVQLIFVFVLLA